MSRRLDELFAGRGRIRRTASKRGIPEEEFVRVCEIEAEIDKLEAEEMAPDLARMEGIVKRFEAVAKKVEVLLAEQEARGE